MVVGESLRPGLATRSFDCLSLQEGMMSQEEEDRARQIAKEAVKQFMDQIYRGVGKGLIERVFWMAVGAVVWAYFGGHLPR